MQSHNNFRYSLEQFSRDVSKFNGKAKLVELVEKRLDKTLSLYKEELKKSFDYGRSIDISYTIKSIR